MTQVYHLCIAENKVGSSYNLTNALLKKCGVEVSLKYRKLPFPHGSYLVFWWEKGKAYFSRINQRFVDAFFFKDGKEMWECKDFDEILKMLPEFNEKGYVTTEYE